MITVTINCFDLYFVTLIFSLTRRSDVILSESSLLLAHKNLYMVPLVYSYFIAQYFMERNWILKNMLIIIACSVSIILQIILETEKVILHFIINDVEFFCQKNKNKCKWTSENKIKRNILVSIIVDSEQINDISSFIFEQNPLFIRQITMRMKLPYNLILIIMKSTKHIMNMCNMASSVLALRPLSIRNNGVRDLGSSMGTAL
ncbi:hypothetical protein AGLY_002484 [Aphis glycines]|uniref:Uncharacterized protein n=1 Tax=Aphis glycines TaxID=307491 RepID=A0A6G0U0V8_APHGL|nr:hypothetical protein AGLY_002484 [Aphis glycines]